MAAHKQAGAEERAASREVDRLEQYERDLAKYREHAQKLQELETKIRTQFETITNIGAAKNVVFDSTKGITRFLGYFKNPAVSLISSGVGTGAEALRGPTSSDLLGIIPGSTNSVPGGADIIGSARTAGGLVGDLADLQGLSSPALTNLGNAGALANAYEVGYEAGQILQGTNPFAATPVPRVGNIFNLPSDQLESLADSIRADFDPGVLEELNGIDNYKLARDVDQYREARDATAKYGQKIRKPDTTLDEARQKEAAAAEKHDQAAEDVQDAIAELAEALRDDSVTVEKK